MKEEQTTNRLTSLWDPLGKYYSDLTHLLRFNSVGCSFYNVLPRSSNWKHDRLRCELEKLH